MTERDSCHKQLSAQPIYAPYMRLTKVIDISQATAIIDPWGIHPVVVDMLRTVFPVVTKNSILGSEKADSREDPLQPKFYKSAVATHLLDAVITVPPTDLTDLAIPLAARYTASMAAFYVPAHFLTIGPPARLQWLQDLNAEKRMCVICGMPKGPTIERGLWLCVFPGFVICSLMVKGGRHSDTVFVLG